MRVEIIILKANGYDGVLLTLIQLSSKYMLKKWLWRFLVKEVLKKDIIAPHLPVYLSPC